MSELADDEIQLFYALRERNHFSFRAEESRRRNLRQVQRQLGISDDRLKEILENWYQMEATLWIPSYELTAGWLDDESAPRHEPVKGQGWVENPHIDRPSKFIKSNRMTGSTHFGATYVPTYREEREIVPEAGRQYPKEMVLDVLEGAYNGFEDMEGFSDEQRSAMREAVTFIARTLGIDEEQYQREEEEFTYPLGQGILPKITEEVDDLYDAE